MDANIDNDANAIAARLERETTAFEAGRIAAANVRPRDVPSEHKTEDLVWLAGYDQATPQFDAARHAALAQEVAAAKSLCHLATLSTVVGATELAQKVFDEAEAALFQYVWQFSADVLRQHGVFEIPVDEVAA